MVPQISLLVRLVDLLDAIPSPAFERQRGRLPTYPDQRLLKALVITLVRGVSTVDGLRAILERPTMEMQALRERLMLNGRFPSRRTWERRLNGLPASLPARIARLGSYLVAHLQPWANCGQAAAIDSTVPQARGGVWHKKHRDAGVVPHHLDRDRGALDQVGLERLGLWLEAPSGHDGCRRLDPTGGRTDAGQCRRQRDRAAPAQGAAGGGSVRARRHQLPGPRAPEQCAAADRLLVATRRGAHPHRDDGVEVRGVFHTLRSLAIENFNGQCKGIFDAHGSVPTRGLVHSAAPWVRSSSIK
jgi:hypothetical protein